MRYMMILSALLFVTGLMTGCGGKDASAQTTDAVSGTATLVFHLPDNASEIRCYANVAEASKIQVSNSAQVGGDQYKLSGSIKVMERNATLARLFIRMMLYKNAKPDGSFDFTVEVKPGKTKSMNLGQGMMLDASL